LTLAQYKQIESLNQQGKAQDAIKFTSDALLEKLDSQAKKLGYLETLWKNLKNAASGFWDWLKSIGRDDPSKEIANLEAQMEKVMQGVAFRSGNTKCYDTLKEKRDRIKAQLEAETAKAEADSAAAEKNQAKIDAYSGAGGASKAKAIAQKTAEIVAQMEYETKAAGLEKIAQIDLAKTRDIEIAKTEIAKRNADERFAMASSNAAELAARIKQMRTGVEAGDFERLRRDPGAFFTTTPRAEAGAAIGKAKQEAGINVGVTDDIGSLTKENISRARNIQGTANKAQDAIAENLEKGMPSDPKDIALALEGVNKRLTKLERSEGRGSPSFQQWSQIKTHLQGMLEEVAPDVRSANKEFSRVALRDKFMEPFPVNQAGTMSKINAAGFIPLAATGGAVMGGGIGGVIGAGAALAGRSPFVAGLGTALRGLADKAIDPALSKAVNVSSRRGSIGNMIDSSSDGNSQRRKAYASFIDKITSR